MSLVIDPYRFAAADTFIMAYRQDVMAWSSVDGSGGMTYSRTQGSTYLGGGVGLQTSLADSDDGDYMEWFVNLAAGTYTLTHIYEAGVNRPIVTFSLDGVDVATHDTYFGSTAINTVSSTTGIVVGADGNYTLRMRANGKNASSADFRFGAQAVNLTRTGA